MTAPVLERRRSGWDIVLGILMLVGGIVVLGNVVVATAVSIFFMGWMTLIAGACLIIGSLFRIRSGGFWSTALGGAILAVLGLFIVTHPGIGALSLTLMAAAMFLVSGIVRIVVGSQAGQGRWLFIVSGAISVLLGLLVLFNLATATATLLGVLLGIQLLVEGFTLLVAGRVRIVPPGAGGSVSS